MRIITTALFDVYKKVGRRSVRVGTIEANSKWGAVVVYGIDRGVTLTEDRRYFARRCSLWNVYDTESGEVVDKVNYNPSEGY